MMGAQGPVRAVKIRGGTYLLSLFLVEDRYEDGSPKTMRRLMPDEALLDGPDYVVGYLRGEIVEIDEKGGN
jgi:hypothetical protein